MAKASTTEVFNCTPEQFYKIISDYEKYHEFLAEVKQCKVLKTEGNRKLVEYNVQVIKSLKYSLWMTENAPTSITWEFASGDIFKTSVGSWKLENEAGKTRATYTVEATFSMFVPGPIANALVSVNLPNMISSYHKRVKQLYGV
ncbi:type II toxin-antitoxin system RatA family toxin [Bdellovibrio bacteriovorus]|uniref:SRPBCC family protein n=1 Tax=Bdellovibrio reynosensis TaxID=2835041 RepID=A0ABY4CDX3_9BACT|nr:SRPBCC family protein [Bdellovibrio reynosensis]UOF02087.1 SRPBCC family protein [Bdellovibrio reynosensis]